MASPGRPVVVFVDDLQWAGRPALGFVDLVLGEEPAAGLLLVAAYRDGGVDAAQPLAAPLARWREMPGVRQLRLGNLPVAELGAMVAEMLQGTPATAGLAGVIEPYTAGNPYETVELLNALRRDGVLTAAGGRWRWRPRRCARTWATPRWPGWWPLRSRRCRRCRGSWWRRWRAWAGEPS